jgi:hypothetical protein
VAIVQGEGAKIEVQTTGGWRDISDFATSVEIGSLDSVDVAALNWKAENVTYTVQIEEWKEVVETANGKAIAAKPRTEM